MGLMHSDVLPADVLVLCLSPSWPFYISCMFYCQVGWPSCIYEETQSMCLVGGVQHAQSMHLTQHQVSVVLRIGTGQHLAYSMQCR